MTSQIVQLECDGETLSLEDATVLGYARCPEGVMIQLSLWDSRRVRLTFSGVVGVREILVADLSFIRQERVARPAGSCFVLTSIREHYGERGGPVSVFDFIDPDDRVSLRIVCADGSNPSVHWIRGDEE